MKSTLTEVCECAEKVGLSIDADKTDLILFTKRYKVPKWTTTPLKWRNQADTENTGQIPRPSTVLQGGMKTQCSGKGKKGYRGAICIQEDA